MNRPVFKSIGFGAYDGYQSLDGASNTAMIPRNPQMDGWIQNKANELGISAWEYFKPMVPWFIVSNLITAIVIWKVASIFCSGRLMFSEAKHAVKSGIKSAKSGLGSIKGSAKSGFGKAKSAVGLKMK